jgi:hypothetical protein
MHSPGVLKALPLLVQAVEHSAARNAWYRWALLVVWLSEAYLLADRWHDVPVPAEQLIIPLYVKRDWKNSLTSRLTRATVGGTEIVSRNARLCSICNLHEGARSCS